MTIDHEAARQFLRTAYQPDDWIAVFLKPSKTGRVAQRIAPVSLVMAPTFQIWLARESEYHGANVFVSVNTFSPRLVSRRRSAVAAIRHVFLDADDDGATVLADIAERRDVPAPSYVLHSSPRRLHIFWRVTGFTIERVEALQKHLVTALHTDPAATSAAQLTRLAGYWNRKRRPASLITVDYGNADVFYTPSDFSIPGVIEPIRSPLPSPNRQPASDLAPERARRYVASSPPAVAGQHGDIQTFRLCCRLVRGFALSDEEALAALREWNARCEPPWSDGELMAKLRHARRYGREPVGGLLATQP